MKTFQIVVSPDIVDVLRLEHEQIRRLYADVGGAGPDRRQHALAALRQAVHRHLLGEVAVVHPAVRNCGPDAVAVAVGLQVKGEQLDRSLTRLVRLGVEHPDFDAGFAAVSDALLDHAADQERDEFPLLRRHLPADRLHMMASTVRDVRIMALGPGSSTTRVWGD